MSPFQIAALSVLVALMALTVVGAYRRWLGGPAATVWFVVWAVAGMSVMWPDATTRVARVVGIHRGADLFLYCGLVVMMIGFLMVYVRLRRLRRDLTLLARDIAIRDAHVLDDHARQDGSGAGRVQPGSTSPHPTGEG